MAPRYLLDTNIVSDLARHPQGEAAKRVAVAGEGAVCTSVVVAAELRFGAVKSGPQRLSDRVVLVLSALEVLPLELPVDRAYASIRWQLTRRGTPIGPNDLLIATQALVLEPTLVTANTGEFARGPCRLVFGWHVGDGGNSGRLLAPPEGNGPGGCGAGAGRGRHPAGPGHRGRHGAAALRHPCSWAWSRSRPWRPATATWPWPAWAPSSQWSPMVASRRAFRPRARSRRRPPSR